MLQEYHNNSNNTIINGTNKRKSTTTTMITYGIYTNDNGLITYNEIPTFIMNLLNYQVMLINTIVPVTVNVKQSALCGEVIPQFPTKPTAISNEDKNNIEEQ